MFNLDTTCAPSVNISEIQHDQPIKVNYLYLKQKTKKKQTAFYL